MASSQAAYSRTHPDEMAARNAVYRAVKDGRLPVPESLNCVECNQPALHYHHHQGYGKEHRLDVVPLCETCHKKKANNRIASALPASNSRVTLPPQGETRTTFNFPVEWVQRLKVEGALRDMAMKAIVMEAVDRWLEANPR